ncbi:hypothetical protein [Aerosakkonema funiforme]|uniref:hypothetical protein n=1 Tax=Aerosakkonema funiforme TaxID=1246630 RepID=UPI001685DEE7|nr:hypothetical protein [Aerosakkonema funiforme]
METTLPSFFSNFYYTCSDNFAVFLRVLEFHPTLQIINFGFRIDFHPNLQLCDRTDIL